MWRRLYRKRTETVSRVAVLPRFPKETTRPYCFSRSLSTTAPPLEERHRTVSLRLYRILLRQCHALPQEDPFLLQPPLNPSDYGKARLTWSLEDQAAFTPKSHGILRLFRNWKYEQPMIHTWFQSVSSKQEANLQREQYDRMRLMEDLDDDEATSLWVTADDIRQAVRLAMEQSPGADDVVIDMHRLAMDAIQALQQQESMQHRTSVALDDQRGVRVVATSQFIGITASPMMTSDVKYRFAYRIRIENLPTTNQSVQLLGRTWRIQEETSSGQPAGEAVVVNAPKTGAVGHLPVLRMGDVFEYMSGCELGTKMGNMSGYFHMAEVEDSTPSARTGDPVEAFRSAKKFEMPIHPFSLIAEAY